MLVRCVLVVGTDTASARSVTSSPPGSSAGRGRLLVTDSMLTDAIRRVRPTGTGTADARVTPARGEKCDDDRDRDDGVKSPVDEPPTAGGRRLKPRPVTMAPTGGTATSAAGGQPEWLTRLAQRRTREVTDTSE